METIKKTNMKHFILISLLILTSCNMTVKKGPKNITVSGQKDWLVSKTIGSIILFRDGSKIDTKIQEMKYLFTLSNSKEIPYFVLSGRLDKMSDENISIFIFSLGDTLKSPSQIRRYSFPGKEFDYESNKLNFESKLLYTKDLKKMIWIQSARKDSCKFDTTLFVVKIDNGILKEKRIYKGSDLFKSIISNTNNFLEIKGQDVTSEP